MIQHRKWTYKESPCAKASKMLHGTRKNAVNMNTTIPKISLFLTGVIGATHIGIIVKSVEMGIPNDDNAK